MRQNTSDASAIVHRAARGCEAVDAHADDVGGHAGCERADVVATQHRRAAARREAQRFAGRHGGRAVRDALQQHRVARFVEHVRAVVRGRAVHAQADAHAGVALRAHRRDAAAQPHVGGRAVRHARARARRGARVPRAPCGSRARTTRRDPSSPRTPPAPPDAFRTPRCTASLRRPSRTGACASERARACAPARRSRASAPASPRTASTARRRCASSRSATGRGARG